MTNYKDANEYFKENKEAFKQDIDNIENKVIKKENEKKEESLTEYFKESAGARISDFINKVKNKRDVSYYSTGFSELDRELDGGLFEGLYFIGAVSSLGKTTLCLQIADQLANQGHDVLFFTLEQSGEELMAKSISRLTYELSNCDKKKAKTIRGVTDSKRYDDYSDVELHLIMDACKKYEDMTKNKLFFIEGIGNIGVENGEQQIRTRVQEHIEKTGKNPIVIVDYIQILQPSELRASDKQNTDRAVNALKRLSRDYKIPIIGISSFNRDNYNNVVSMVSFKESGAIEYSSDVLLGLQPSAMNENQDAAANKKIMQEVKKSEIRKVKLVILKNRNGRSGGEIEFDYYSCFNYFEEITGNFRKASKKEQEEKMRKEVVF